MAQKSGIGVINPQVRFSLSFENTFLQGSDTVSNFEDKIGDQ